MPKNNIFLLKKINEDSQDINNLSKIKRISISLFFFGFLKSLAKLFPTRRDRHNTQKENINILSFWCCTPLLSNKKINRLSRHKS